MKKVFYLFVGLFAFNANLSAQDFESSCAIQTGKRVLSSKDPEKSCKTISIMNFDKNYQILDSYAIDNIDFNDDGKNNDLRAGDGIYTSVESYQNLKDNDNAKVYVFASKNFKFEPQLNAQNKFGISCHISITHTGTTILGNSCRRGCILLSDCEISFEF